MRSIGEVLGFNVQRLRKDRRMTQEELANRTSLSATMIAHIENNRKWVRQDTVAVIASQLGVKPAELFLDPELVAKPTLGQALSTLSEAIEQMREIENQAPGLMALLTEKVNTGNANYLRQVLQDLDDPTPVNGIRTETKTQARRGVRSAVD